MSQNENRHQLRDDENEECFNKNFETTTFFLNFLVVSFFFKKFNRVPWTFFLVFVWCGVCLESKTNLPAELILDFLFGAFRMWSTSSNKTSNLVSSKWGKYPSVGMQLAWRDPHDMRFWIGAVPELFKRPKAPLLFWGRVLVQYILGLILLLGSVWRSLFVSFCDEQMFHIFDHISSWYIEIIEFVLKNKSLKLDPSIGKNKKHWLS